MSDLNAINYQPLNGMNHAFRRVFEESLRSWPLGVFVAAVLVGGLGLFVIKSVQPTIIAAVLYASFLSYRVSKYKNQVWQYFAEANGWQIDTATPGQAFIPPSLQFGHDKKFSPVIMAQLGGTSCGLFTYKTTTGMGKYQTTHNFTVSCVVLPKSLPHLVLLSKKATADMRQDLANHEKLSLEGDFNDYFTLQVEKGQEIDVLAILAPDVMQILVDNNQSEDIEIFGSSLYFIMGGDERNAKDVQNLINSVVPLSGLIIENVRLTTPLVAEPINVPEPGLQPVASDI